MAVYEVQLLTCFAFYLAHDPMVFPNFPEHVLEIIEWVKWICLLFLFPLRLSWSSLGESLADFVVVNEARRLTMNTQKKNS